MGDSGASPVTSDVPPRTLRRMDANLRSPIRQTPPSVRLPGGLIRIRWDLQTRGPAASFPTSREPAWSARRIDGLETNEAAPEWRMARATTHWVWRSRNVTLSARSLNKIDQRKSLLAEPAQRPRPRPRCADAQTEVWPSASARSGTNEWAKPAPLVRTCKASFASPGEPRLR